MEYTYFTCFFIDSDCPHNLYSDKTTDIAAISCLCWHRFVCLLPEIWR